MSEIKFFISEELINALTWEEYEAFEKIQEGTAKLKDLRPTLARFMVNGDGRTPIDHKEAMKILGKLPMSKVRETAEKFTQALQTSTIPKVNGSPSSLPIEANQTDSPSLDG